MNRLSIISSALVIAWLAAGCAAPSKRLKLAAGPVGGTWYSLAGALKNVIEHNVDGVWVQVLPGGGVANAKAVEIGRAHLALANSVSTVDAVNGAPPFNTRATHVCNLATLYPQYYQVVTVAGSGIDTPADFKGRVIATQPRGNTGEAITQHLLRAYGMSYDDLGGINHGSYNDSVSLMKDGNAQIFTLGTSVPAGPVMDLASARAVALLDIPDDALKRMQGINAGYTRSVIPPRTYPGQTRPIATIGYSTHLIARCDLEDKLVARILDGLHSSLSSLSAAARDIRKATPQSMSADIGVPMHPRAAEWYRDKGVSSAIPIAPAHDFPHP